MDAFECCATTLTDRCRLTLADCGNLSVMAGVVNLQDIVDELSLMFEENRSFVDRETGEVVMVTRDDLRAVEDPGPHDDDDETAVLILEHRERFKELPSKWEVNDWEIMREFCEAVESAERRGHLLSAIRGNGAFGRFKTLAAAYGMLEEWYAFHDNALWELARDWCEENEIPYTEKSRRNVDRRKRLRTRTGSTQTGSIDPKP